MLKLPTNENIENLESQMENYSDEELSGNDANVALYDNPSPVIKFNTKQKEKQKQIKSNTKQK